MAGIFSKPTPQVQRVMEALREEVLQIARAHPKGGGRLPTEKTLIQKYNISERTVREAVGILVHDGLVERRQGSGMYTCDLRRFQHVAILAGALLDRDTQSIFSVRVCHHAMAELSRQGLRSRWYWPIDDEKHLYHTWPHEYPDLVADLKRGAVSGLVGASTNPHPDWFDLASRQSLPMASTNERFPSSVTLDVEGAIAQAVDHMVAAGARRLAMLAWSDPELPEPRPWRAVFRESLAKHGLTYNDNWVRDDHHPEKPGAGWEGFREIWSDRNARPDGLVVCDDFLYRDAVTAIAEAGVRVPDQLRLATSVNRGMPLFHPFPVALMEFDPEALGQALAQVVVDQLQGESPVAVRQTLPCAFQPTIESFELRNR